MFKRLTGICFTTVSIFLLISVLDIAHAASLLQADFSKSLSLGPYTTNDKVYIIATMRNVSPTQTITICPGICVGDANTYSLGGNAGTGGSVGTIVDYAGYSYIYSWGNGTNTSDGDSFNDQLVGTLLPGQSKDFVAATLTPTNTITLGAKSFSFVQLQIFAATPERPMVSSAALSSPSWQVINNSSTQVPVLEGWWLLPGMLAGLGIFARRRKD